MKASTIEQEEIDKFSAIADEWWDPHGKFAPLHRINPVRIDYIKDQIDGPLKGLDLLDIGCGGGLIAEPMAELGANVTAIDASEKNIAVAKLHAEKSGLDINYQCTTAEELAATITPPACGGVRERSSRTGGELPNEQSIDGSVSESMPPPSPPLGRGGNIPLPPQAGGGDGFDIVLALEIIEHVADVELFVKSVMMLVKPGGIAIFSTLNRTAKAYALAIVGAEYILRWLPTGTHDWHKFVTPSELKHAIDANAGEVTHTTGMVMNPLNFEWSLKEKDLSVNYLLTARKE